LTLIRTPVFTILDRRRLDVINYGSARVQAYTCAL